MSHGQMALEVPVTRTRAFWIVVGYAAILGLVLGLIAVVFIGVIAWLTELIWTDPSGYGLFEGEPWWILLIGVFGLLIGLARHYLKVEPVIPGLFEDIAERRVEPTAVPRRIVIALISLVSGASVGPEAPLGAIGGGIGTWASERQGLSKEIREVNTLSGMAGAFGGFFSSPLVSSILVIEAAKPSGARKYVMTWVPVIVAAVLGFAVFLILSGSSLMGIYDVPPYEVTVWSFLLAVPLGILGALVAALLGLSMGIVHRLTLPLRSRPIPLAVAGGLIVGAIAWAFPLTLFNGMDQLADALNEAPTLGAIALFLLAGAKILAVAISFGTGFWGGPIFPMIFIGGVTGAGVHALFPDIPEALAVASLFAAVPGAGAALPFTLSILAAFSLTLSSPMEAAPAILAAAISYAIYNGFLDIRQRQGAQPDHKTHAAAPEAVPRGDQEADTKE